MASIDYAVLILYFIVVINIGLAIFNLIPVPPLDGSKIVSYFTSARYEEFLAQNQMVISIIFMALLFTGLLSVPMGICRDLIFKLYVFATNWIEALVA